MNFHFCRKIKIFLIAFIYQKFQGYRIITSCSLSAHFDFIDDKLFLDYVPSAAYLAKIGVYRWIFIIWFLHSYSDIAEQYIFRNSKKRYLLFLTYVLSFTIAVAEIFQIQNEMCVFGDVLIYGVIALFGIIFKRERISWAFGILNFQADKLIYFLFVFDYLVFGRYLPMLCAVGGTFSFYYLLRGGSWNFCSETRLYVLLTNIQ